MIQRTMLTLLMAAALSAPVLAQPAPQGERQDPQDRHPGRGEAMSREDDERMPGHDGMRMMESLKLTEAQKGQMEKLRTELEKKQVTIHGKIAVLRVEMKELVQADNPDRNAIEKKMREVSDLQYQLKVNGLDHQFAVKGILTPEQQKIWKKHLLRMGEEQMGMEMERAGRMMRRERQ